MMKKKNHDVKKEELNLKLIFFFKLGFTPCKDEQPLRGMELQEKKAQKRLQDTENLFRKNLQLKDVC